MGTTADSTVARLASDQAGCVARQQALDAGISRRMISGRLARGLWVKRHPGVYAMAAVPGSWFQEIWAAVLAVGGEVVVSHDTALLLADVVDDSHVRRRPIVLTTTHGRHPRVDGAVVHQIDDVRPGHVERIHGLTVTTAPRAVVDVAAATGERELRRLVDGLLVGKQTTRTAIASVLHDVARNGKPGVTRLGRILDELGDGYVPPESELERLLLSALATAGLPAPRRQIPLPGNGPVRGLVDAGYEDVRLLLEADGRRWHTRQEDFVDDRAREAQAARGGWQTLRFTWEQLVSDPAEVAATVADVRRARMPARAAA
jgi:very-short-patch-repair endonuclease